MKKQYILLIAGPCGSGKTTLANKITEVIPSFQHIDNQGFRDFVSSHYRLYKNLDSTQDSFEKRSMNRLARSFIGDMLIELIKASESVIVDATLLRPDTRSWRIEEAKRINPNITTIIIGIDIDQKVLEARLAERDATTPGAHWVQNHREFVVDTYELPNPTEADHVYLYKGDDTNCFDFLRCIVEDKD